MWDGSGGRAGCLGSGQPLLEVLSPCPRCLPGPAAKWKFPSRTAHLCSRTSLHPAGQGGTGHRALQGSEGLYRALQGCSAPSAPHALPGHPSEGNLLSNPTSDTATPGTRRKAPARGVTFTIASAGSEILLLAACPWEGGRIGARAGGETPEGLPRTGGREAVPPGSSSSSSSP